VVDWSKWTALCPGHIDLKETALIIHQRSGSMGLGDNLDVLSKENCLSSARN